MAALNRPVTATYAVNETVRVDTQDNEDHTFCGIMFPIRAKAILPIEHIVIQSVAVRGSLGDISVWISNDTTTLSTTSASTGSRVTNHPSNSGNEVSSFKMSQKHWTKVYQHKHRASPRTYQTMDLTKFQDQPITLQPGQVRMMYIHSTLEGDTAIVYDNSPTSMFGGPMNRLQSSSVRYEDDKIAIHTGKAHLSFVPFGQEPIWGWGNAWRDRREFVGQIQYGTVYKLWHPERHSFFGKKYHAGTEALLMLQRRNTLFARLPDECIYYILNMCRWDWFDDTSSDLKTLYRRRKGVVREQQRQRMIQEQMLKAEQEMTTSTAVVNAKVKGSCEDCCKKQSSTSNEYAAMDIDEQEKEYAMDEDEDDEDFNDEDEVNDDEEEQDDEEHDDDDDDDDGEDEENNDEDSNASSAWERDHGYRADTSRFVFHNVSSDEDEDDDFRGDDDDDAENGHQWFGRRSAIRQVVVRALGGGTRAGYMR